MCIKLCWLLVISDELSDLRGQVKLLEDKNTKYMQENLELQEVRFLIDHYHEDRIAELFYF